MSFKLVSLLLAHFRSFFRVQGVTGLEKNPLQAVPKQKEQICAFSTVQKIGYAVTRAKKVVWLKAVPALPDTLLLLADNLLPNLRSHHSAGFSIENQELVLPPFSLQPHPTTPQHSEIS